MPSASRLTAWSNNPVTTSTRVIEPMPALEPTPANHVVAAFAGLGASIGAGLLTLFLQVPLSFAMIVGLIIGTVVAGRLIRAKGAKGWVVAFGLVACLQLFLGWGSMLAMLAIAATI